MMPSSSCLPAPPPSAWARRCSTIRWYARRSIAASREYLAARGHANLAALAAPLNSPRYQDPPQPCLPSKQSISRAACPPSNPTPPPTWRSVRPARSPPAVTPCCSTDLRRDCPRCATWLAEWQGVKPEQVLAGNGSLELIEFLCTALLKPGDVVFTEAPSYDRAITLFRRHGLTVIGVPLETDGPNIAALEKLLAQHTPRLFYVIPDFQNPSGATCSAREAQAHRRTRRAARPAAARGCALPDAALPRHAGAHDLFAGATAHAAHDFLHQADRAGRAAGFHDRRCRHPGEDRQGG